MAVETRSASQMVKLFSENSELMKQLTTGNDPKKALRVLKETAKKAESDVPAYVNDVLLYRIVVIVLGVVIIIGAVSSVWLALRSMPSPDLLVALGSASVGALAGLFAHSPVDK